jgi:hypothetical protein
MAKDFKKPKKVRKVTLITPPNLLKKRAGKGGFDPEDVVKAQTVLEENTVDFKPMAIMLIKLLDKAAAAAKSGSIKGESAIESIAYPAMQLRAQGAMFHYPLVTEISDILVNFLETVDAADKDVLDIVSAHRKSLNVVITGQIKDDGKSALGKELCGALVDVCNRYYKKKT